MSLVKVTLEYSDGSSTVVTGDAIDPATLSALSPDELMSAESAKLKAEKDAAATPVVDAPVAPAETEVAPAPVDAPAPEIASN